MSESSFVVEDNWRQRKSLMLIRKRAYLENCVSPTQMLLHRLFKPPAIAHRNEPDGFSREGPFTLRKAEANAKSFFDVCWGVHGMCVGGGMCGMGGMGGMHGRGSMRGRRGGHCSGR